MVGSGAAARLPQVRVVVLNYNGGALTKRCLEALLATDWPAEQLEVVLVDNASSDGLADEVERTLPVRVIRSGRNLGFAGGCNLALRDLDAVDYVALINNDVEVPPGWLAPLVEALDGDTALGAASPKMLLGRRYLRVEFDTPTFVRSRGDRRSLGVRVGTVVRQATTASAATWSAAIYPISGFWGLEPSRVHAAEAPQSQWTDGHGEAWVPMPEAGGPAEVELYLEAERRTHVELRVGGCSMVVDVEPGGRWYRVTLDGKPVDVINNVGSIQLPDGYGADRGFLEPDDGQYAAGEDVQAWCGGAVLLRATYLRDVGLFDERLFLYYEDLELSLRGAKAGWRYRYVPQSVVRHDHSAATGSGSRLSQYYNERNRLLVLMRHASVGSAARAVVRYLMATASYARRDILAPALGGQRPAGAIVGARMRAFAAFLLAAPSFRRACVGDQTLHRKAN